LETLVHGLKIIRRIEMAAEMETDAGQMTMPSVRGVQVFRVKVPIRLRNAACHHTTHLYSEVAHESFTLEANRKIT
jgi:hypothetical protein